MFSIRLELSYARSAKTAESLSARRSTERGMTPSIQYLCPRFLGQSRRRFVPVSVQHLHRDLGEIVSTTSS